MVKSTFINLSSLLSLSEQLNSTDDIEFILNSVLLSTMGKLRFRIGTILVGFDNHKFSTYISKGKKDDVELVISELEGIVSNDGNYPNLFTKLSDYSYAAPLTYNKKIIAVIFLGKRIGEPLLDDDEFQYLNLICTIASNSIQRARNYNSLKDEKTKYQQQNQVLASLFELGRDFATFIDRDQIIKMMSFHLMGQLMVNRFAVYLCLNNEFELLVNRLIKQPDKEVLEHIRSQEESVFAKDIGIDNRELAIISPMKVRGTTKGFLIVGNKLNGINFNDNDLSYVQALSNIAGSSLENERLFKEEIEKRRIETDLNYAKEIQKNLLPKKLPSSEKFDFAGMTIPSRQVGGDYYDFIQLSKDKMAITIADVSGKGMPASLIMANLQSALRILAPIEDDNKKIIERINKTLYDNTSGDKFVTMFYCLLDNEYSSLKYINAGHNPPMLLRANGKVEYLNKGGLILGFTDSPFPYEEDTVILDSGDLLYLYTDGVSEAKNEKDEEFGEERMLDILNINKNLSAKELSNLMVNEVRKFCGKTPQFDDITLILLKAK